MMVCLANLLRRSLSRRLVVLATLLLLVTACIPAAPAAPAAETGDTDAATEANAQSAAGSGEDVIIKLAVNPWSASELNVAVASILLEEELGYTVEQVAVAEQAQWPALAAGDLHASLEVWPSGHMANVQQYIEEQGVVEDGGLLGPVGRIGWYLPSYLLDEHPELATWEGLANDENAALFATAETGDAGQLLFGDPSWVTYEADIIENLGLNFQIVQAGSEEAIVAALDAAYSREDPILFYFWTPHSIHAKYELTRVELPEYTEECYAEAESGGVDCDYPPDELFKIFWPGLQESAPAAYELLHNMQYSTDDQISMIAAVELDGATVEEAARAWLDNNAAVWQAWLPQN
ncbi:MAG: ABC transporter substrate-binding protein [Caldilineaceae bacterium]|nr:ABC transporter substrate-binding protein [Caldilineaceae bacterium]